MSHIDKETIIEFFSPDFNQDEVLESLHRPSVLLRQAVAQYVESTRPEVQLSEGEEAPELKPYRQTGVDKDGQPVLTLLEPENMKFIGNVLSAVNPVTAGDVFRLSGHVLPALDMVTFNDGEATFSYQDTATESDDGTHDADTEENGDATSFMQSLPSLIKGWDPNDEDLMSPIGDIAALSADVRHAGRQYLSAVAALYMTWLANMQHTHTFSVKPFPVVWK